MNTISELKSMIKTEEFSSRMLDIYVDRSKASSQTERYENALNRFRDTFADGDENTQAEIYSAPGRSEIGGNHTDHQHGEVLAASINDDTIAVVTPCDGEIRILSEGYSMISVSLDDLAVSEKDFGTTAALIRGVAAGCKEHGYRIGGFKAYITSDVLSGSGLSSSAAFETVIGTIISGLYNDMKISAIEIAIIGQYAENKFFGKPCGLMDQMACSVGGLCHIDFLDPQNPKVEKIEFDLDREGYSIVITDTKGSHADLTDEYAAIPEEMHRVAAFFGKDYLVEVSLDEILSNMKELREKCGDRAVLRAIHFEEENKRTVKECEALKAHDTERFLKEVTASGNSSFKYLQNVYPSGAKEAQNVSIALAASESVMTAGASRVHGGGFAGTIQAFVKNSETDKYRACLDSVFGEGSAAVLKIRKYGGIRVI